MEVESGAGLPVAEKNRKIRASDGTVTVQVADGRIGKTPEGEQEGEISPVDAAIEIEITPRKITGVGDAVAIQIGQVTVSDITPVPDTIAVAVIFGIHVSHGQCNSIDVAPVWIYDR